MARILFDRLLREVASSRLTQTNEVDDSCTQYDANCPKDRFPIFCAVIFMLVMTDSPIDEQSKPRTGKQAFPPELPCTVFATVVMGQYPATVSERLRQGSKMASSARFVGKFRHSVMIPID
jgi:hypothetical protein